MIAPSHDAHGGLGRMLSAMFRPATAELQSSSQRRWASVTFNGARHRFSLRVSGDDADGAVAHAIGALAQQDFALEGHVVADVALVERHRSGPGLFEIELEALTVEAG